MLIYADCVLLVVFLVCVAVLSSFFAPLVVGALRPQVSPHELRKRPQLHEYIAWEGDPPRYRGGLCIVRDMSSGTLLR